MNLDTAKKISQRFSELYQLGLTTSSGGNISCRDEELICISPSQIDKGYLNAHDFSYLTQDGEQIGDNKPSMEYPFHLSLYKKISQINAIIHLHPPVLVALSLLNKNHPDLKNLSEKYKIGFADYAIPGSDQLGSNICDAFQKGVDFVLMENHGLIAIGKNINDLKDRIIDLNEALVKYFGLGGLLNNFKLNDRFELKSENSVSFYEKRAKHFLGIKNEVKFFKEDGTEIFYSAFQPQSLKLLYLGDFSTHIIPESFLILKNPLLIDETFDNSSTENYLELLDAEVEVLLFKDAWTLISGKSLYNLYDKMEVLNFTAKVILLAQNMGNYDLLDENQIQELKEKFNIQK